MGSDSLNLCGPVLGLGAKTPPNLSNIHDFGAAKRFKCFLGPRAYRTTTMNKTDRLTFNNKSMFTENNISMDRKIFRGNK